jgi:hypothetical protein
VDAHQIESARTPAPVGLVRVAETPAHLAATLASDGETAIAPFVGESGLAHELRDYLTGLIDARSAVPA